MNCIAMEVFPQQSRLSRRFQLLRCDAEPHLFLIWMQLSIIGLINHQQYPITERNRESRRSVKVISRLDSALRRLIYVQIPVMPGYVKLFLIMHDGWKKSFIDLDCIITQPDVSVPWYRVSFSFWSFQHYFLDVL